MVARPETPAPIKQFLASVLYAIYYFDRAQNLHASLLKNRNTPISELADAERRMLDGQMVLGSLLLPRATGNKAKGLGAGLLALFHYGHPDEWLDYALETAGLRKPREPIQTLKVHAWMRNFGKRQLEGFIVKRSRAVRGTQRKRPAKRLPQKTPRKPPR